MTKISYQDTKIPYIRAKTPATAKYDLWSTKLAWLYRVNTNFPLTRFPFAIDGEVSCQPEICSFGQHLSQFSPVQGPQIIVTPVDSLPGCCISFTLHGAVSDLFLEEVRENVFVLEGHQDVVKL